VQNGIGIPAIDHRLLIGRKDPCISGECKLLSYYCITESFLNLADGQSLLNRFVDQIFVVKEVVVRPDEFCGYCRRERHNLLA